MSHPVPGHDYSERDVDESKAEYHQRRKSMKSPHVLSGPKNREFVESHRRARRHLRHFNHKMGELRHTFAAKTKAIHKKAFFGGSSDARHNLAPGYKQSDLE